MTMLHEIELSADEIAAAYWTFLAEKEKERRAARDHFNDVMADSYVSAEVRQEAEVKLGRLSDNVIILGQVIERAKAARLVTMGNAS